MGRGKGLSASHPVVSSFGRIVIYIPDILSEASLITHTHPYTHTRAWTGGMPYPGEAGWGYAEISWDGQGIVTGISAEPGGAMAKAALTYPPSAIRDAVWRTAIPNAVSAKA